MYQRAKVGINAHNRGDYTVGGYRPLDLPVDGVMQISDEGSWLDWFFAVGEEIVSYASAEELIDKVRHYLAHHAGREQIAISLFSCVRCDYAISTVL